MNNPFSLKGEVALVTGGGGGLGLGIARCFTGVVLPVHGGASICF